MAKWTSIPNMARIVEMQPVKLRRPVPDNWEELPMPRQLRPMRCWVKDGLQVLVSTDKIDEDGGWWLHVSTSRPDRLPSWEDLRLVKDLFIGRQNEAIQVLPADRDYVNLHPNCLHLWSPENS